MGNAFSNDGSTSSATDLLLVILLFVGIGFIATQTEDTPPGGSSTAPPTTPPPSTPPTGPSTQPLTNPNPPPPPPPPTKTPPTFDGGFLAYMKHLYKTGQLAPNFFKDAFPDVYQAGVITYDDYLAQQKLPPSLQQPMNYKSIFKQNYGFQHQATISSIMKQDDVTSAQATAIFYQDEKQNIIDELGPYYNTYKELYS